MISEPSVVPFLWVWVILRQIVRNVNIERDWFGFYSFVESHAELPGDGGKKEGWPLFLAGVNREITGADVDGAVKGSTHGFGQRAMAATVFPAVENIPAIHLD